MADKFECAHVETQSFKLTGITQSLCWCKRCGAFQERYGAARGPWTLPAIVSDKHFVFLRKLARALNSWGNDA